MADVKKIQGFTSPGQRINCRSAIDNHAAEKKVRVNQAPTGEPETTQQNNCRHNSRITGKSRGWRSDADYGEDLALNGLPRCGK